MNDEAQPATSSDWFCEKCGSRNEAKSKLCETCNKVGNEINSAWGVPQPRSEEDLRRGRVITQILVLVAIVCVAGVLYLCYRGVNYLQTQSRIDKAYELHLQGSYPEAIAEYSKVIERDPGNVWARSNRASAYFYTGDFERSEEDYNRAIAEGETSAETIGYRGTTLMQLGKYRAAVMDYERAKVSSHDPQLVAGIMYCQFTLGDLDGALKHADTLVKDATKKSEGLSMRAYVSWERGDTQQAEVHMREAIAAEPDQAYSYVWLACILANSKPAEAEALWKTAFEKGEAIAILHATYGEYVLLRKGENPDAHFRKALTLPAMYTQDYEAHYLAFCGLGRVAEVETHRPRLEKAARESRWQQFSLATGCLLLARKSDAEAKARYHEKAIDYLEKAFVLGLRNGKAISDDRLLPDLKSHPRYQKLISAP